MGAGLGAIFRVPMAGALFAAEILYSSADLEADVIVPAAVASTVSYSVFSFWLPPELRFIPLFGKTLTYQLATVMELLPMTFLAIVLVLSRCCLSRCFTELHHWFKKFRLLPPSKPAIGALLAGVNRSRPVLFASGATSIPSRYSGQATDLCKSLDNADQVAWGILLAVAFSRSLRPR